MKPLALLTGLVLLAGCGEREPGIDVASPDPRLADAKRTVTIMGAPNEPHHIGTMSPLEMLALQNR